MKFYVTTPIYYPTAHPHVGSLYSTLIADVIARWQRLESKEVFFLTGTDEHGQKIQQAASKAHKTPQAFVDEVVTAYKHLWKEYNIDYSKFIRTTDQYHIQAVQQWLQHLIDKGDIYKDYYQGWYCVPCETFVSHDINASQEKNGPLCESCQRQSISVSEESYFFRLSSYQDKLLEYYSTHPDFILPSGRFNEVINFVQQGLKDLSISRTTLDWGIKFPHDTHHVAYVWADALLNYLTGVGYLQNNQQEIFNHWWPAQAQVMGKDIVRFHAVYWPAFLMASDLALPKHLIVHGWITMQQQKMSKSFGNVIDPQSLLEKYDQDTVRYYLIKESSLSQDMDFSLDILEQRHNADLANDLGNLLNRITQLASKNQLTHIVFENVQDDAKKLLEECGALLETARSYMNNYMLHMALGETWRVIGKINAYFHAQQPWQLAKNDKQACARVLAVSSKLLCGAALLCWPVMPKSIERLFDSLGLKIPESLPKDITQWLIQSPLAFNLNPVEPLFRKIERIEHQKIAETLPSSQDIEYADFAKVILVVGTIIDCQVMPKSEKLYVLQVDCGQHGTRQILSGIQALFKPSDLINKQVSIVLNLKPRSMMGKESHGMLLIAGTQLVIPEQLVENGTPLR